MAILVHAMAAGRVSLGGTLRALNLPGWAQAHILIPLLQNALPCCQGPYPPPCRQANRLSAGQCISAMQMHRHSYSGCMQ